MHSGRNGLIPLLVLAQAAKGFAQKRSKDTVQRERLPLENPLSDRDEIGNMGVQIET